MALNPDFLRQVQSQYGQQMSNQKGPMGDAAFDDGSNIQTKDNNSGGLTTGIAGGISLLSNMYSQANRNNNINTSAPAQDTDAYGKPQYNLGNFAGQTNAINTSINGANIAKDTAEGALAGTAIAPGIGTLIGAGVGLVGGAISEVFGSNEAKKKKRLAQQTLMAAQNSYNTHMSAYNNMQLGEQQYQDLKNPTNRLYNIYKSTTPY